MRLGAFLDAFERLGGYRAHGLPGLTEYIVEVLGLSPRWCFDAIRLHRRLTHLTHIATALEQGTVGWSMAEALARTTLPGREGEALARSREATVREVLGRDPGAEAITTLDVRVAKDDVKAYEATRMLVRGLTGSADDMTTIEAMAAETWGRLRPEAARQVAGRLLALAPAPCDPVPPTARCPPNVAVRRPELGLPVVSMDDPGQLDEVMVDLANAIATRDVELGEAACVVMRHGTWRAMGYDSFATWCELWVGMSLPSVKKRMTLARRLGVLGEPLRQAIAEGRLGLERACLVARVATPHTIVAWLARAGRRSVKHLAEEIDVAVTLARLRGDAHPAAPPDDAEVAAVHEVEREVLDGGLTSTAPGADGSMSGETPDADPPVDAQAVSDDPPSDVLLKVAVPTEVAQLWRALEEVHEAESLPGSFVAFACTSVWAAWPHEPSTVAYQDVYRRDRWRCASPWCKRTDLTPHHIVFRSQGGRDAPDNLVTLCTRCHLDLVHGGHLRVEGTADRLVWVARDTTVLGRARRPTERAAA
ncbi:MAG: HNH endonuclease [Deltaproteobacteria bacterium]|nr:HNH endonuclease [Deltaproteobacteria bacterium]